jgi:hypothetical protein
MLPILGIPDRRRTCHNCQERPRGCWKAVEYGCTRDRVQAGFDAAAKGNCPLNKWNLRPPLAPRLMPPTLFQPSGVPIDVVYFLGPESQHDDWELRYSLRSLHANFRDLGRIFIVGHRPRWLHGIEHLAVPDRHAHNKDANLIEKLLAAIRWGVSAWFLNPSDDQILLRPVHFADCRAFHLGDLRDEPPSFWGGGSWKKRLENTLRLLDSRGLPTFHHDAHTPMPIHGPTFAKVAGSVDFQRQPGYTIHTLYANSAPIEREPLGDQKATYEHACHFTSRIQEALNGRTFLGYSDEGMTPAFMSEIEYRFPRPSPWESGPRSPAPASLQAPDHPPATLLFHFFPWLGRTEMTEFHLRRLERHLWRFNKVRINIATGDKFGGGFADPASLETRLMATMRPGTDVKFFRNPHDQDMQGETVPFFRDLLPEVGEEENVCYAHSKGQRLSPMPAGRAWADLMYREVFTNSENCIRLLDAHPCVGPFIHDRATRGAAWYYSGTFFWFRGIRRFAGWQEHHPSRFGVENWLGRFVARAEAAETIPRSILLDYVANRGGLLDKYLATPWEAFQ